MNKRLRKAIARVKRVYQLLPSLECKGLCAECCGPIAMTELEYKNLRELSGGDLSVDEHLTCSLLHDGRCSQYADRPGVCRLWGVSENMPCEFGCKPDRYLTRQEGNEFLASVERAADSPTNFSNFENLDLAAALPRGPIG
jgi:hypothetical protein